MSIINHSKAPLDGKITLKTSAGLKANPDTLGAKIEPQGLEAYVFSVNADKKLAPGHYAVFININDKSTDWAAIDVPVLANKASGNIAVDGKLDDWKDPATVTIAKLLSLSDGKAEYQNVGKGEFCYDQSNFYMAFDLDSAESVKVGFDTLINGAKAAAGGYKDDDYEYSFTSNNGTAIATISQAPDAKKIGQTKDAAVAVGKSGATNIYEISIPWSALAPFKPAKDAKFALSVLVNKADGSTVEWGGGLAGKVDPRRFIPVVLAE
jgi:hypothetical protein